MLNNTLLLIEAKQSLTTNTVKVVTTNTDNSLDQNIIKVLTSNILNVLTTNTIKVLTKNTVKQKKSCKKNIKPYFRIFPQTPTRPQSRIQRNL